MLIALRRAILSACLVAFAAHAQSGSVRNAAGVRAQSVGAGPWVDVSGFFGALAGTLASLAFVLDGMPTPVQLAPGSLAIVDYSYSGKPGQSGSLGATVSLRPAGSSTLIRAQVIAADTSSITFVMPPSVPAGAAQLIYRADGDTTKWLDLQIVPASFALFGTSPGGPLQAQVVRTDGSVFADGLAHPATTGQAVVLWGSGLGSTSFSDVHVTLGGVSQTVLYAGAAPNVPGVNQINFRVAAGTPDGCYVPLTVSYGANSVSSFLSKTADGQPCTHPFGLSLDDLNALDSGARINVAQIAIASNLQVASVEHAGRRENANLVLTGVNTADMSVLFSQPAQGCGVNNTPGLLSGINYLYGIYGADLTGAQSLSNGTSNVMLLRDNGFTATFSTGDVALNALAPPFFGAGKWTWKTDGGENLAASQFTFSVPAPVQLSATSPVRFVRDRDQTISWNGADYTPDATVTLTISAMNASARSSLVSCVAAASTGVITVPKETMAHLDAGAATVSVQLSTAAAGNGIKVLKQKSGETLVLLANPVSSDARAADIQ